MSQLLTLFITPVLYLYMDRLQTGLKSLFRRKRPAPEAARELPVTTPAE